MRKGRSVAIIEMSRRLKLKVISECVETAEQVKSLQGHGCDQAQGYYFARHLPIDQLEALWQESGAFSCTTITAKNEKGPPK